MDIYFGPGGSGNFVVEVEDDMNIAHNQRETAERTSVSMYDNSSMEVEMRVGGA